MLILMWTIALGFEISFVEANTDLDIDLGNDSETIFLVTPQIIVHPIDEDSVS